MKKTVLYFCGDPSATGRFGGICAYGRQQNWNVKFVNYGSFPLESYLRIWKPDGIISDSPEFSTPVGSQIPTVFLDAELTEDDRLRNCTVERDPKEAARLAFDEFERLGLKNLAFLPPVEERLWSDRRRDAFIEAAAEKGLKVNVYPKKRHGSDSPEGHARISKWASKLPRPCGVFVANDITGSLFLSVCTLSGIKVPEELAVISVDGNPTITENTYPSMTSVASADAEGGRLAAEMLDGLMSGAITTPQHETFGELCLLRKDSSKRIYNRGSDITDALDLIRRNACEGLQARDVLALMHGSRRNAEIRFRAETGKSVLEAINCERLEHAKRMLRSTTSSISEIARACGYASASYLRTIFERETGMTMGEWRQSTAKSRK